MSGWIGVDLDGTLAVYGEWRGPEHIGPPIPAMVARVKAWLDEDRDVRIFTARIAFDENGENMRAICAWCREHLGRELIVTNVKDYGMIELWDDRAIQVVPNTGQRVDGQP